MSKRLQSSVLCCMTILSKSTTFLVVVVALVLEELSTEFQSVAKQHFRSNSSALPCRGFQLESCCCPGLWFHSRCAVQHACQLLKNWGVPNDHERYQSKPGLHLISCGHAQLQLAGQLVDLLTWHCRCGPSEYLKSETSLRVGTGRRAPLASHTHRRTCPGPRTALCLTSSSTHMPSHPA